MIYEKKSDQQLAQGNREDGEDFLRAAIRQIERVLDMNPDSVADREKLDELLEKLDDLTNSGVPKKPNLRERAQSLTTRVPLPWLAGAGTFAIVFIVLTIMFVKGKTPDKPERLEPPQAAQLRQRQAQSEQQLPPAVNTPATTPSQQPAWSYQPQQTQQQPQTYSRQPAYQYSTPPSVPEPRAQLSPLPPYPVEQPRPTDHPKTEHTVQPAPVSRPESVRNPGESARSAFMKGDYASAATLYEQAISNGEDTGENQQKLGMCLYNLNKREAALEHFQRAVQLYMAQKAAGADVNAAIDTCKLYIDDLSRR
jgi:tetratricopeptide (TPR) repeat protein